MEAEEGQLARMEEKVVLEADGHFEDGVTLGTDLVFWVTLVVDHVTQAVEHDLVTPAEFLVALVTRQFAIGRSPVPVHAANNALT